MDASIIGLAAAGACLGISAIGSAFGCGIAGMAAIGAWKKCYAQDKSAPFIIIAFVGAPLTQTIYGFILMNSIMNVSAVMAKAGAPLSHFIFLLLASIFSGTAIAFSAIFQGKTAASSSVAFADTGKGFGNYMMVVGMLETIALFTMIFMMVTINKLAA